MHDHHGHHLSYPISLGSTELCSDLLQFLCQDPVCILLSEQVLRYNLCLCTSTIHPALAATVIIQLFHACKAKQLGVHSVCFGTVT